MSSKVVRFYFPITGKTVSDSALSLVDYLYVMACYSKAYSYRCRILCSELSVIRYYICILQLILNIVYIGYTTHTFYSFPIGYLLLICLSVQLKFKIYSYSEYVMKTRNFVYARTVSEWEGVYILFDNPGGGDIFCHNWLFQTNVVIIYLI